MPSLRAQITTLCKGTFRTKQYVMHDGRRAYVVWYGNSMVCEEVWPQGDKGAEQAALQRVVASVRIALDKLRKATAVGNCITMATSIKPTPSLVMDIFDILTDGLEKDEMIDFCAIMATEFGTKLFGR